jgi:Mg2+-importing ATPase
MTPEELKVAVKKCNVFARVAPEQKFLIIKTLKEENVVGYQGDGINDAPSLKLADVAIAVEGATEVAQANADIVLLQKGLGTIISGIEYGRAIFVNINKYIKYTMIGNFGNFFALIVLYLLNTSLPLLAVQLLVTNLINDAPLITIATDNVERDEVAQPEKYNIHALMFLSLTLGTITAIFELIFFLTLKSSSSLFTETSLFLFIIFIQLVVIFSIRSKHHFWKAQRPSFTLLFAIFIGFVVSLAIPYIPIFDTLFSLIPLPLSEIAIILLTIFIYFFALDVVKVWYYQALEHRSSDEGASPHTYPRKTARSAILPWRLNVIE